MPTFCRERDHVRDLSGAWRVGGGSRPLRLERPAANTCILPLLCAETKLRRSSHDSHMKQHSIRGLALSRGVT
jgi:hypothetical protein